MVYIFSFVFFLLILIWSSSKLLKIADVMAEQTRITTALIGFLFVSVITSLPELSTSFGANFIGKSKDMAFSDIIGSNAFNFGVLFLLIFLFWRQFLDSKEDKKGIRYIRTFLFLLVYYFVFLAFHFVRSALASFIFSVAVILGYVYILIKFEGSVLASDISVPRRELSPSSRGGVYLKFLIYAGGVVVSGVFLAMLAKKIAILWGLTTSFVGALFLAVSTSLPELTVTWMAMQKPSTVDIGVGNVIGSNLFNINIIALNDLFSKANFYNDITLETVQLIFLNVVLTVLIVFFFGFRKKNRLVAVLGTLMYVLGFWYIYLK